MKILASAWTGFVVFAFASGAFAKSDPHRATVDGPGLDEPVVLTTDGQGRSWPHAATLALAAGLHTAVWGEPKHKLRAERPRGDLGPKYGVTYQFASGQVRQELYPYALPSGVSYTPPGQEYADGHRGTGGWYVDAPALRDTLGYAGLPEDPPTTGGDDWTSPAAIAVLGIAMCLAALSAARRGRSP